MDDSIMRRQLVQEIGDYLFTCFQWASSFDDGHGHMHVLSLRKPVFPGLENRILAYQRATNPVFARYCDAMGVSSESRGLLDWHPLPVECFKRSSVCPFPEEKTVAAFCSSGTTSESRSVHRFMDIGLLQRSIIYQYANMIGRAIWPNTHIISLMPSWSDNPHSSLAFMIQYLSETVGGARSCSCFSMSSGLDVDRLKDLLRACASAGEPVHLMGPAFAYVTLLDALGDETLVCAPNSALLETGGYKGRTREIPKSELRDSLSRTLGIERTRIYGEYGMCELSGQAYELCSLNARADLVPEEGLFLFPPWMKCVIYSPDTMRPVLPDHDGQIAIFDPCNLDSVSFILTGDIGRLVPLDARLRSTIPGHPKYALRLYGRAPSAVPKGCSMSWEEWSQRGHENT